MTDTAPRQRERKERLEDILVVDADVHVHESPAELIPYCEMPWRVALENIKDVQEFYLDIPGFSPGT
ncbi:MAG: amidohydrolase, partial [Actinomycetota bacterium]|nr:amidohydrolase [Actinomycetota bacterium]